MITNIWKHIRNKELEQGFDKLSRDLIDDPQEYYQWLCDNIAGNNRTDGHNDF